MLRRFRPRLTYANVMVTVLAFIVLGGGAYAVAIAPKNSVTSTSIANGAIKSADVKNGGLKATDLSLPNVEQALGGDLSSGLVKVNVPSPGTIQSKVLAKFGPFLLTGRCINQGGEHEIQPTITPANGGPWNVALTFHDSFNGGAVPESLEDVARSGDLEHFPFNTGFLDSTAGGQVIFTAIASGGQTLSGTIAYWVNLFGADCAFDFVGRAT